MLPLWRLIKELKCGREQTVLIGYSRVKFMNQLRIRSTVTIFIRTLKYVTYSLCKTQNHVLARSSFTWLRSHNNPERREHSQILRLLKVSGQN